MTTASNEVESDPFKILTLSAEIVAAYVSNNSLSASELPAVIGKVHAELMSLVAPPEPVAELVPAVPVKKSVSDDHIVCLEDGKKLKMLKRHLMSAYGMTPDQYRAKWGLAPDYPMVAPAYARTRQDLARRIGLGRKKVVETKPTPRRKSAKAQ